VLEEVEGWDTIILRDACLKGVVGGCDEKRVESSSRELVSRATVVVRSKRDENSKCVRDLLI
jgi:hypothetical protein